MTIQPVLFPLSTQILFDGNACQTNLALAELSRAQGADHWYTYR